MFTSESAQYTDKNGVNLSPQINVESMYYEHAKYVQDNGNYEYDVDRQAVVKHMAIQFEFIDDIQSSKDICLQDAPIDTKYYNILTQDKQIGEKITLSYGLKRNTDGDGVFGGSIVSGISGGYYNLCPNLATNDYNAFGPMSGIFALFQQKYEFENQYNKLLKDITNINNYQEALNNKPQYKELLNAGVLSVVNPSTGKPHYPVVTNFYNDYSDKITDLENTHKEHIKKLEKQLKVLSDPESIINTINNQVRGLTSSSNLVSKNIKNINSSINKISTSINICDTSINNIDNLLQDIQTSTSWVMSKQTLETVYSLKKKIDDKSLIPGAHYNLLYCAYDIDTKSVEKYEMFPYVLQLTALTTDTFSYDVIADKLSDRYFEENVTVNIKLVQFNITTSDGNTAEYDIIQLYDISHGDGITYHIGYHPHKDIQVIVYSDDAVYGMGSIYIDLQDVPENDIFTKNQNHTGIKEIAYQADSKFHNFQEIVKNIKYDQWSVKYDITTNRITYLKDHFGNVAYFDFINRLYDDGKKTYDLITGESLLDVGPNNIVIRGLDMIQFQSYYPAKKICYNNTIDANSSSRFSINVTTGKGVSNNKISNSSCIINDSKDCNISNSYDIQVNMSACTVVNSNNIEIFDSDNIDINNVCCIKSGLNIKSSNFISIHNVNIPDNMFIKVNEGNCIKWYNDYATYTDEFDTLLQSSNIMLIGNESLGKYCKNPRNSPNVYINTMSQSH